MGRAGRRSRGLESSATILRLYGRLESWFDKSWRSGEIEAID